MLLPAAVREAFRRNGPSRAIVAGAGTALLILSCAATKRTVYFLPVVPAVTVLLAGVLDQAITSGKNRPSGWLRVQAAAIGLGASFVPLVPALSDGRLTPHEVVLVGSVGLLAAALFLVSPGSRALVASSLALAIGSLVLLDRFSVPRLRGDAATAEFFARVSRRLDRGTPVYSYRLNEDVLGRACLEMPVTPAAEDDPNSLARRLSFGRSFVLAECRKVSGEASLAENLVPVERGITGGRVVALYRSRATPGYWKPPTTSNRKSALPLGKSASTPIVPKGSPVT